jgi:hypothetical protein
LSKSALPLLLGAVTRNEQNKKETLRKSYQKAFMLTLCGQDPFDRLMMSFDF